MLEINTKILENASISVDDMAIYLRQHGWQELAGKNDKLVVFQGINDDLGNALLLVLPRQEGSADAVRYLAQALEMVAFLENQSLEDSLHQIEDFSHESWSNRGISLSNLGRHEEAIKSYDRAISFKPDDHESWSNRGISLSNLGRYEEAIESYDRAISSKPDDYEAWNNRGISLGDLGRYEEAIESYDRAISSKPDDYEAWYNRAVSLTNLGRYEEASKSYNRAISFKLGEYVESIKCFEQAIAIQPDNYHS